MKIKTVIFIILLTVFVIHGHGFEKEKNLILPMDDINQFDIDCGAGFLVVNGIAGLDKIEVKATIIIEGMSQKRIDKLLKNHLRLELKKTGSKAILVSKFKSVTSFITLKSRKRQINLEIRLPQNLPLNIDDGSGSIDIKDLSGAVTIDDGSGSMTLKNIQGKVNIEDGSGSITLINMDNNVKINDGSGDIVADKIKGHLKIIDGSGSIYAKNIGGEVNVRDGSGSIKIRNILGSVIISDGSGSIIIEDVEQDVIIKEAGSGDLSLKGIKGKVIK